MTVTETRPPTSPAVTGEDRFRARRIEVRRAAGRRRLQRLIVLAVACAVVLVGLAVAQSPLLDVDRIAVRGTERTTEADLLAAAGIEPGDTMLTLDLGRAAAAVETLPWVETAKVSKSFPGDVVITVTERVPSAIVAGRDGVILVDALGRVLDQAGPDAVGQHPVVVDRAPVPRPGEVVDDDLLVGIEVAGLVAGLDGIAAIEVDPVLEVRLISGGVARFGDRTDLRDKVDALATVVARVDLRCLETLDLRVPTHPVVTREDPC